MSTTSPDTKNWKNWNSVELANYLKQQGCGDNYAELFLQNKITGQEAPDLKDDTLKEMGITIVGDRLRITKALQQLRQSQAQAEREEVLWQGHELLYVSWFQQCCQTCAGCCPQDAATYTLRSHHLEIKTVHPCRCGPLVCCGSLCGATYEIDNIDLSEITDADVKGVPPGCCQAICCCGVTQEHVILTTGAEGEKVLKLPKDVGQDVARRVKNQVEIMQRMERS
ncbi:hypothetical protein ACA910_008422 [Epithemia clementina (nom. ined.)]